MLGYFSIKWCLLEMKKQTKPEVFLDDYLNSIGLWRKQLPRDGLSLFRAVSEQLFMTQFYHTNLYEACRIVFFHLRKDPEWDWNEYEVMNILSRMYKRDFLVYECAGQPPVLGSYNNYKEKIVLCRVNDNQLDSVYPKSVQESAAIVQSVVYEILYRGVFKLDTELTDAVELIRDQNKRKMSFLGNRFEELEDACIKRLQECGIKDPPCRKPTPPLPYRIAKALDPCIFRNVELDIWEEECRELKKESPEYRKRFSLGDKCQVILEGEHYHGHIQELKDDSALVYIQELGEKRIVLISSLKTPPSARYRFNRKHLHHKQETEASGEEGYYSNQTSHYHSHQSRSSTPRSCNTPPLQRYKVKPQGYIYPANPITMINGNEAYVGMEMQQVPTLDNENKRNLNQLPAGGVLEPYQQAMMYPQPGDTSGQYMYGPMVAHGGQMYSCVCVPHLDSIAIQDVNVYCPPSQDMAGNDLPEVNTLRFFFNMGVENYRSVSQNGSYQTETTPALVAPGMYMTADQVNGNYFGPSQAFGPIPGSMQYPVFYSTGAAPYPGLVPGMYMPPQNCNVQPPQMPVPHLQATQ
ncbi:OTU domain-containing protein 4-like isoform X2 [Mya arenaria]|uniref:OTU domain-containing protein 4-like isoform X2 n=1 Tax=Mya arenaria TaxID=6604 RepID=UPI0022DF15FF|nr:OTU domain-containing protein 4-like isoform X2 [Mya arenaria]